MDAKAHLKTMGTAVEGVVDKVVTGIASVPALLAGEDPQQGEQQNNDQEPIKFVHHNSTTHTTTQRSQDAQGNAFV